MNFFKKLFGRRDDEVTTPIESIEQEKYTIMGVSLMDPTYNALLKRYESENGRPATEEEKQEIRLMASKLLQGAFTNESGNNEYVADDEYVDYRYQAHQVLGYFFCYHNNFQDLNSFYDLNNAIKDLDEIISRLDSEPICDMSIKLAIRYCRIQYMKGECTYCLSKEDEEKLLKRAWEYPNTEESIRHIIPVFKDYWDGVLQSYKRSSARVNRLNYLVNLLDGVLEKPYVQQYDSAKAEVANLRDYYIKQLE